MLCVAMLAAFLAAAWAPAPANAAAKGGPILLMGIDAEDGGPGSHGPVSVYGDVVDSVMLQSSNGGSGILVVGGGKSSGDDVTSFWNAVAADAGDNVTYVNGASAISSQSFSGFAMIAVVSDEGNTFDGGLTQAESDALAARKGAIKSFVNGGGGLLGFASSSLTNPYGYLGDVGSFSFNFEDYEDITATAEGTDVGITDDLDICCWHDEYDAFPSYLEVLATNPVTGKAAAIGGADVVVGPNTKPEITNVRPTGSTRDHTPKIGATVLDAQSTLKKKNITLFVEGKRINRSKLDYNGTSGSLEYNSSRLNSGKTSVKIVAKDPEGLKAAKSWSFKIR